MTVLIGHSVSRIIPVYDQFGVLVPGATWSILYAKIVDGNGFAQSLPVETDTPGLYLVSMDPVVQQGHHRILRAAKDTKFYYFFETIQVASALLPFEHYVNSVAEEIVFLVDTLGSPLGGATFTVMSSESPDGTSFILQQEAIPGLTGAYILGVNPTATGAYFARVQTNTVPIQTFDLFFEVHKAGSVIGPPTVTTLPDFGLEITPYDDGEFNVDIIQKAVPSV